MLQLAIDQKAEEGSLSTACWGMRVHEPHIWVEVIAESDGAERVCLEDRLQSKPRFLRHEQI